MFLIGKCLVESVLYQPLLLGFGRPHSGKKYHKQEEVFPIHYILSDNLIIHDMSFFYLRYGEKKLYFHEIFFLRK